MNQIENKEIILDYSLGIRNMRVKENLYPLFQKLEEANLPKPNIVMWTDEKLEWKNAVINSFIDINLLDKLDPYQRDDDIYDVWIDLNSNEKINIKIGQSFEDRIVIIIVDKIMNLHNHSFCRNLFVSILSSLSNCETGRCDARYNDIYRYKFEGISKPYLGWIQYFNNKMIMERGGFESFESNPLLKTERIHDGLLIQVGESPYDAFTPEGEELLVRATRSLPPVRNNS
ncbi:MAG: hypothetical protein H7Y04_11305 [Verrucomicrobia bacterium]|nr:hypothetical protein [Cytophagales bacterium]